MPTNQPQHERIARHPIRAAEHEAAHVQKIVDEGESPATPAILVGVVVAFLIPIVTLVMLLAFGVAHFSA